MPAGSLDLPLDVRGTAFQQQVWQVLRGIPPGETVSYAQLAHRMGRPGSARAVASAVASNGIAVAIPCHRVIGSDGSLRGYRWGLNRKAGLLRGEREANQASASNKTKPD
jgi:AraC family transcriptional regulator of adaptative response/methylated-DNA-[protein]-cysteine methyltransferase